MSVPDPRDYPLWCWIDYMPNTNGCRFSLIRPKDDQTILQEGFNSLHEAVTWGQRRMKMLDVNPENVYTRVGSLTQDDETYHFIHDVFDENTALVCKLMLE